MAVPEKSEEIRPTGCSVTGKCALETSNSKTSVSYTLWGEQPVSTVCSLPCQKSPNKGTDWQQEATSETFIQNQLVLLVGCFAPVPVATGESRLAHVFLGDCRWFLETEGTHEDLKEAFSSVIFFNLPHAATLSRSSSCRGDPPTINYIKF